MPRQTDLPPIHYQETRRVVAEHKHGRCGFLPVPQASNADYEIPFLRKQTASLQRQVVDHERKAEELKSSAKAAAAGYKKSCEELSIQVLPLLLLPTMPPMPRPPSFDPHLRGPKPHQKRPGLSRKRSLCSFARARACVCVCVTVCV